MTKRERLAEIKARAEKVAADFEGKRADGTATLPDCVTAAAQIGGLAAEANAVATYVEPVGPVTVLQPNYGGGPRLRIVERKETEKS